MNEPGSAQLSNTYVWKLKNSNLLKPIILDRKSSEYLPDESSAPLEFTGETPLSGCTRVSIKRALNMNEMVAHDVDANDVQFSLEPSLRPRSHLDRTAYEISVVLKPLGDQLL
jgi:hypothetical protein